MTQVEKNRDIVRTAAIAAAGVGVPGALVPGLDAPAVASVWIAMATAIAANSGHSLNRNLAVKLVAATIKGSFLYWAGSKALTTLLAFSGVGMPIAVPLNAAFNYIYTANLGEYLSEALTSSNLDAEQLVKGILGNPTWLKEMRASVFRRPSLSTLSLTASQLGQSDGRSATKR